VFLFEVDESDIRPNFQRLKAGGGLAFKQPVDTFGSLKDFTVGVEIADRTGERKEGTSDSSHKEKLVQRFIISRHDRCVALDLAK